MSEQDREIDYDGMTHDLRKEAQLPFCDAGTAWECTEIERGRGVGDERVEKRMNEWVGKGRWQ